MSDERVVPSASQGSETRYINGPPPTSPAVSAPPDDASKITRMSEVVALALLGKVLKPFYGAAVLDGSKHVIISWSGLASLLCFAPSLYVSDGMIHSAKAKHV